MNNEIEYILCAANWYPDLELKDPKVLEPRGFSPYNIKKGIVFCGWRHPCCLYQMVAITGLKQYEAGKEEQGFLTSKNRFVDRREAAEIAYISGQIPRYKSILYSEDIY